MSVDSGYQSSAVIRDRETGEIVSHLAEGCYYHSFYQENDTAYVLGTKSQNGMLCSDTIMLYESRDLINWSSRNLITRKGWQFFNFSLTKGENGYVLLLEFGPYPFSYTFAVSPDMFNWTFLPDDCIDIIHEDYIYLYKDYKFFVDLTGCPEFSRNHRCISVEEAPDALKNWLPCEVSGGVHWFVNKTSDGCLLVMFNNSGIVRSVEKGEYILPEGTRKASVRLKDGQKLNVLEGAKDIHFENGEYHIELQPGAWFLARFKSKPPVQPVVCTTPIRGYYWLDP